MIEPTYQTAQPAPATDPKRISWGAVLAGAVVAMVTQLLLNLLGLGIGASTIDPVTEQNPVAGIGVGAGLWFVVSAILALFAGGWVAGRLAGVPRKVDSALHGVLTWGSATLVTFFLLTTAVGALISGAAGVLGKGISQAGQGIAAVAPQIAHMVKANTDVDLSAIKQEATELLRQTDKAALQPSNIQDQATDTAEAAATSAEQSVRNPQTAEAELTGIIDRIAAKGQNIVDAVDRDALVNVLVARTDLSKEEASATVARWEKAYQQLRVEYDQAKDAMEQQAREVGGATANAVSHAAFWTFIVFLFGGAAAAAGGLVSAPRESLAAGGTRPLAPKMAP